jgi:glucose-1-phosphate adenylyltransferase
MAIISAPSLPKRLHRNWHATHYTPGLDMSRVATIILGGGQGTRLFPLTDTRCKPAICFGGRYSLIDVPVSNAINSDCHKIFVVTQFLSSALHRHLFQTYHLDNFSSGFMEILTAEQRPSKQSWYQGTADAVRENINYLIDTPVDYFLILSGDQLYNFDFRNMVQFAKNTNADLVIGTVPVDMKDAQRMGILKIDENDFVTEFHEKPKDLKLLESLRCHNSILEQVGIPVYTNKEYLANMGIYLFKRQTLLDLLEEDTREDFGKHLIPTKVKSGNVSAFLYGGYWEDIGTIESFYKANIALTKEDPEFKCYDEHNPIYTTRYNLPGPKISNTFIDQSIICEGSMVEAESISSSILGPRTVVRKGAIIKDAYVMGNDFYHPPMRNTNRLPEEIYIGEQSIIRHAIIDKNVCIGKNVQLTNKNQLTHYDGDNIYIRDGIIVVTRGAHIPDGFVL